MRPLQRKQLAKRVLTGAAILAGGYAVTAAIVRSRRQFDFRNQLVLITGGTRGFGLAMARQFADAGAQLAICSRKQEDVDRAWEDLTPRSGYPVLSFQADITDPTRCEQLVRDVVIRAGRPVNVLVNNAGTIEVGPLDTMEAADFERAMATHFRGPLHLMLAVLPAMRHKRSGRIVNIASIGGKIPVPHLAPYSASKFALVGLSEAMRVELTRDNVFVTTVIPGLMRTGSAPHARFRGNTAAEHAWFTTGDVMPGISISAERMAAHVLAACRNGDAELIGPLAASMPSKLFGLFPGTSQELIAVANRFLPTSAGGSKTSVSGGELNTRHMPTLVQRATHAIGRTLNE